MTVRTSPGGLNALRPVVLHSVGFRRWLRKKKVSARSFFSTPQCLCQRFSAGSNEVRAPKECVSGNKHQQIPSNPDSLSYAHTHMHTQPPPSTSPETKLKAWEKDGRPLAPCLAPCIQLREVTEESLCPPAPLPYSRGVHPSPPASITFEDEKRPESNTGKCTGRNVPV